MKDAAKDPKLYLIHIVESIQRIESYVGEGREAFLTSTKNVWRIVEQKLPGLKHRVESLLASLP